MAEEAPQLLMHLDSNNAKNNERNGPVRLISFCVGCPSPEEEGSLMTGLLPWHIVANQHTFSVTGPLVYSVPNLADSDKIINDNQLVDRIALVDRGKVPLHEKVRRMQNVGAAAVIIADDSQCDEAFLFCGPRAGSSREGGFACHDNEDVWETLTIPVYLITATSAAHLRKLMHLTEVEVRGMGVQLISDRNSLSSPPQRRRQKTEL